jgi:hypothetical protein
MGNYFDFDVFDSIVKELKTFPNDNPIDVVESLRAKYQAAINHAYETR